jgi:hypothetical protein
MKIIFLCLTFILVICSATTSVVSIYRQEWAAIIWILTTILSVFMAAEAIKELKE